jgi:hypothetical protein
MSKEKVFLIHPHTGESVPFDPDHADRLMGMRGNGGWSWPKEVKGSRKRQKKTTKNQTSAELRTNKAEVGDSTAKEEDCGCG